jgi:hypothetical protein
MAPPQRVITLSLPARKRHPGATGEHGTLERHDHLEVVVALNPRDLPEDPPEDARADKVVNSAAVTVRGGCARRAWWAR